MSTRKKDSNLVDRRSGEDRRKVYSLDYFTEGGKERRKVKERRKRDERRSNCVRVSDWSSVCSNDDHDDDLIA